MREFIGQFFTRRAAPPSDPATWNVEAAYHIRLLRRREAAHYVTETWGIPLSWRTLAKLAVIGGGPEYCKVGRYPLYSPKDLDTWASVKLEKKHGRRAQVR